MATTRRRRGLFAALLAGVAAFLAVSSIIRSILYSQIYFDNLEPTIALTELSSYPDTNLVFVGASPIMGGVLPLRFDEVIAPTVPGIQSYNISAPGLSLVEMRPLLDKMLDRACCVKYVVIGPAFQLIYVDTAPNNSRAIIFFDLLNAYRFFKFLYSFDHSSGMIPAALKTTYLKLGIGATLYHYTNLGLLRNALNLQTLRPQPLKPSYIAMSERGHCCNAPSQPMTEKNREAYVAQLHGLLRIRKDFTKNDEKGIGWTRQYITDALLDQFLDLVEHIRARGAQVIVILPPTVWQWMYDVSLAERLRVRCGNAFPLLDYGDAEKYPQLFSVESHLDPAHLNLPGAKAWSALLAQDIGRLIAGGTLPKPGDSLCKRG